MRINIVGGGPAGLYFAILMKQRRPATRVAVYERNAPDDTFGWGVVFSDKTLHYLKENDEESHDWIVRTFETWDNVDVVHRDRKVTIRGNRFSGIARLALLNILQKRCRELDVDLRFRANVTDPQRLKDCDLLVGADGVNSAIRQCWASAFQPSISHARNKYAWYGTERLFHGLTLTFRETEHGVFIAHSYKYCPNRSTFIVECSNEVWARAGLDRKSDPETREWLGRVFAPDLDGKPLLSNQTRWINFVLVRNNRWFHENVVLLGDALHTAHFSIGSGTKLALEDAIALAKCFDGHRTVDDALAAFELGRKPEVDRLQTVALDSLRFFEEAKDHLALEPLAFAYRLMTRSGRIDHENLRRRDPEFVSACEAAGIR